MQKIKKFLFHNTSTKQTFMKNTFWLFTGEALSRLLKMILIIYAARILGVSGWGTFSYALSVASLLMIFSDIGLSSLITREIIQKKEDHEAFISTAVFIKNIILIISIVLVIIFSPIISDIPEAKILFPIIALMFVFDTFRELFFSMNRASEKMEREMIVKTLMGAVIAVLGIVLLKITPEPKSIAITYVIGSGLGCLLILSMIKKDIRRFFIKTDKKLLKTVIQTAWPFAIITLIGSIMGNTDIYMLGMWKNAEEIGLYSSVQRIHQFILIIPAMIATASFPLISRLAQTDRGQFRTILERTLVLIFIVGIPVSVGGIMLGKTIIPLVLGTQYIAAVPIFQVLMIMLIASFPLILLSNAIFAVNKQKSIAIAYICAILVNVILNILLIPKLGAVGSAIATCASTTMVTAILWIKMRRIQYFTIVSRLGKCVVSTIVMALVIFISKYFNINIFIIILSSIGVYFSMLFALKEHVVFEILKSFKK